MRTEIDKRDDLGNKAMKTSRRRLLLTGAAATPFMAMTLSSRPALAQAVGMSGTMSGNMSSDTPDATGISAEDWQTAQQWPESLNCQPTDPFNSFVVYTYSGPNNESQGNNGTNYGDSYVLDGSNPTLRQALSGIALQPHGSVTLSAHIVAAMLNAMFMPTVGYSFGADPEQIILLAQSALNKAMEAHFYETVPPHKNRPLPIGLSPSVSYLNDLESYLIGLNTQLQSLDQIT